MFVVDAADQGRLREARDVIWDAVRHKYINGKPILVLVGMHHRAPPFAPDPSGTAYRSLPMHSPRPGQQARQSRNGGIGRSQQCPLAHPAG
jgi:hypothetical protein